MSPFDPSGGDGQLGKSQICCRGVRHCIGCNGPGDPCWQGRPGPERVARILALATADSRGRRYFYDRGGLRRLRDPADFARLNQLLDPETGEQAMFDTFQRHLADHLARR